MNPILSKFTIVTILSVFLSVAPITSHAAEYGNFCQNIDTKVGNLKASLKSQSGTLLAALEKEKQKTNLDPATQTLGLKTAQSQTDAVFGNVITELQKRAATEVQKNAVKNYQTQMSQALTEKRSAINTANINSATGLQKARASIVVATEESVANYTAAVSAATEAAITNCNSGTDNLSARQSFEKEIKNAKMLLKPALEARTAYKQAANAITTERRNAVDKAQKTFSEKAYSLQGQLNKAFASK